MVRLPQKSSLPICSVPVRPLSPPQDHFTPATAALPCAQALQQRRQRLLRNPAEQRRPEKKRGRNFHTIFSIPL